MSATHTDRKRKAAEAAEETPRRPEPRTDTSISHINMIIPDIRDASRYISDMRSELFKIKRGLRLKGEVPHDKEYIVILFINYLESRSWEHNDVPGGAAKLLIILKDIFDSDSVINGIQTPFDAGIKARAQALHNRWSANRDVVNERERLGFNDGEESDSDDSVAQAPSSASGANSYGNGNASVVSTAGNPPSSPLAKRVIRIPRRRHPIFGDNGIMRGITLSVNPNGKGKAYVLNPTYISERRDPNVAGHNGIAVGTWFPFQIMALYKGAHGSRMGGISGRKGVGAYSIVISGSYSDLDIDRGNSLWYSGSGSHENRDAAAPPTRTPATKLLATSVRSRVSVRVLRSASSGGKDHEWCPRGGLRYDGLYTVVREEVATNKLGGKYHRYLLEREVGPHNPEIDRRVPSEAQYNSLAVIREAVV